MKLSVVIPMYNEAKIAADTVAKLKAMADACPGRDFEIIMVNDGSRDGCEKLAEKAAQGDGRFRVIGYEVNRGKGYAVRTGMLAATGDSVVFTDCDLAYGTDVITAIADKMTADSADGNTCSADGHVCSADGHVCGADVCIGSRNLSPDGYKGYTLARRLMSKAYIKLVALAAGFRHTDSQSGIKCFSAKAARDVFSRCEVNRFAFDLEALIIAEVLGYHIIEMPVVVVNHRESDSKVSPVKDALRMLGDVRKIKKRVKHIKK